MKTAQEIVSFINVSTQAEDIRQYQQQSRKAVIDRQTMTAKTLWTVAGMFSGAAVFAIPTVLIVIAALSSHQTATISNNYYPYNIIFGLVLALTGAGLIPYYIHRRAEQRIPLSPVGINITSRISESQHLLRLETVATVAGEEIIVDEIAVDESDELVAVAARAKVRDRQASIDATAWANSPTVQLQSSPKHTAYPQLATAADVDVAQRLLRQ